MADDKKISELATGSTPDGTELIEALQGGMNVSLTVTQINGSSGGNWIHRGNWATLPTLPSPATAFSTYRITVAGNIDFGLGSGPELVPVGSILVSLVASPTLGSQFTTI